MKTGSEIPWKQEIGKHGNWQWVYKLSQNNTSIQPCQLHSWEKQRLSAVTYLSPVTPSTTRLSAVSVPVLSKQQMSIFPANGIRNGSVQ
ncbi:hypothetical protein DPMN_147942 [Dreissena polymorpha]|uniref:Uncharacterized protein n=1 Tax=Dreissena polymorpha TaxID=45954 RepID=A0A9D4F8N1_DREPO|nr:hypothetical protein DPMN_147942 [Dreissena polymorpha]